MQEFRGIIITAPFQLHNGGIHLISSEVDWHLLRVATLFWDKIEYPNSRSISVGHTMETQFLESTGILQRTEFPMPVELPGLGGGGDIIRNFINDLFKAFKKLNDDQPGQWSFARGPGQGIQDVLAGHADEQRSLLVTLHNAIPIPSKDVPFEEIIRA